MYYTPKSIHKTRQMLPSLFPLYQLRTSSTTHATAMGTALSCFTRAKPTIPTDQVHVSTAVPTDQASLSIALPATPTTDEPFRLLDLQPELVGRVASFVNGEALIAVRLTCKALETITFDRFAAENFGHVYCWIATGHDFRRLKDIIRQSPRLSSRIRQLTLTTDVLRGRPRSVISYVRRRSDIDNTALSDAIQQCRRRSKLR
jgi:hypothetical protein